LLTRKKRKEKKVNRYEGWSVDLKDGEKGRGT